MPKIIHYRSKCIGCGICFELQPETWRMSQKDGKATLITGIEKRNTFVAVIRTEELPLSQRVARDCPVKIIKVNET